MICKKCQKEIPDDVIMCCYCGQSYISRPKKMKKNPNGIGTAYKKKGQKTWTAEVIIGYREPPDDMQSDSKSEKQRIPIKKSKGGFRTKAEALAYCQVLKKEKRVEAVPLKVLYERWEKWYSSRIDAETLGCYRAAYKYFKPLHEENITTINAGKLQQCMDDCPRGHRTHQNMKVTAGLLWKYALDHDLVQKDVTHNLYIGKGQSIQREPLTDFEVEKVRKEIGNDKYAPYIYALCYLGYRPGEMLEIKKDQVLEDKGRLFIIEGKKTDAGRDRIVPVHKKIENIIREQLRTEGTDYLFPMFIMNRKGEFKGYKAMTDDYFNKHAFRPLADRLGIPKNKVPYSARHTFSDKLKKADGNDKDKASLIGHSDYSFTQKKYQSSDRDDLVEVMDSIK